MRAVHDAGYKTELDRRLRKLRANSQPRWGKMSVGQMLWHVNEAMEGALGRNSECDVHMEEICSDLRCFTC